MSRTTSIVLFAEVPEKWWNSLTSKFNFFCRKCSESFTDNTKLRKHKITHLKAKTHEYWRNIKSNSKSNNSYQLTSPKMKQISVLQGDISSTSTNPQRDIWSPKMQLRESLILKRSQMPKFAPDPRLRKRGQVNAHIRTGIKVQENKPAEVTFTSKLPILPVPKEDNNNNNLSELRNEQMQCLESESEYPNGIKSTKVDIEEPDLIVYLLPSEEESLSSNKDIKHTGNEKEGLSLEETLLNFRGQFTENDYNDDDTFQIVLIEQEEVEFVDVDIPSECTQEALVLQTTEYETQVPTLFYEEGECDILIPSPEELTNQVAALCGIDDLDLGATETIGLEPEELQLQGKSMQNSTEARKRNEATMLLRSVLEKTLLIRLRKCDDHYHMPRNRKAREEALKLAQSIAPVEPEVNPVLNNVPLVVPNEEPEQEAVSCKRKCRESAVADQEEEWSVIPLQNEQEIFKLKIKRRRINPLDKDDILSPLPQPVSNPDQDVQSVNQNIPENQSSSISQNLPSSQEVPSETPQPTEIANLVTENTCSEPRSFKETDVANPDKLIKSPKGLDDSGIGISESHETLFKNDEIDNTLETSVKNISAPSHNNSQSIGLIPNESLMETSVMNKLHCSDKNNSAFTQKVLSQRKKPPRCSLSRSMMHPVEDTFSETLEKLCDSLVSDSIVQKTQPIFNISTVEKKSVADPGNCFPSGLQKSNFELNHLKSNSVLEPLKSNYQKFNFESKPQKSNFEPHTLKSNFEWKPLKSNSESKQEFMSTLGMTEVCNTSVTYIDEPSKETPSQKFIPQLVKKSAIIKQQLQDVKKLSRKRGSIVDIVTQESVRKSTRYQKQMDFTNDFETVETLSKLPEETKEKASVLQLSEEKEAVPQEKIPVETQTSSSSSSSQPQVQKSLDDSKSELPEIPKKKSTDSTTNSEYGCQECGESFSNSRHLRHHEKIHSSLQRRKYEMDQEFIDIDCAVLREIEQMDKVRNKTARYTYSKLNVNSLCKRRSVQNEIVVPDDEHEEFPNGQQNEEEAISEPLNVEIQSKESSEPEVAILPVKNPSIKHKLDLEMPEPEKRQKIEIDSFTNGKSFFEGFCKICGLVCEFESSTTHYLSKDKVQPYCCLTCESKFNEADWPEHNRVCFALEEEEYLIAGYRILTDADGNVVEEEEISGVKKKRDFICCQCYFVMSSE